MTIEAGENIMLNAEHSTSTVAAEAYFVGARDEITQSSKQITLAATKTITLTVGDSSNG